MRWSKIFVLGSLILAGGTLPVMAQADFMIRVVSDAQPSVQPIIQRDINYERDLRILANPDQTITPARVLQWLKSLTGHTSLISTPSRTEFQPILNVADDHVRIVATIAYKF